MIDDSRLDRARRKQARGLLAIFAPCIFACQMEYPQHCFESAYIVAALAARYAGVLTLAMTI
jgi:hypothetical protein